MERMTAVVTGTLGTGRSQSHTSEPVDVGYPCSGLKAGVSSNAGAADE